MLIALLFLAAAPGSAPGEDSGPKRLADVGRAEAAAPAVRLWLSSDRRYRPGEAVRVQVETGAAGYLLVLQYDPDGRIRVLFPVTPDDDQLVLADRRYEVRDEDQGRSFVAGESGPGLVYAAISRDPFRLDEFVTDGAWNYGALSLPADTRDPEQDLTALVQRMASPVGFDYDLLDYYVGSLGGGGRYDGPPPPSWWSPAYYADPYWYDPWDPFYGCYSCYGYRPGFHFHVGIGSPYWYWPSYWYRPWHYSYHTPGIYYPPYWGHRRFGGPVVVVPRDNVPVIVGRPRGYTVGRLGPSGSNNRTRPGFDRGTRLADGRPSEARPPARRARPVERSRDTDRGAPTINRGGDRGPTAGRPAAAGRGTPASTPSSQGRTRARGRSRGNDEGGAETLTRSSSSTPPVLYAEPHRREPDRPLVIRGERVRQQGTRVGPIGEPAERREATRSQDRQLPVIVGAQRGSRPRAERVRAQRPSAQPAADRAVERRSSPPRARATPAASTRSRPSAAPARPSTSRAAPATSRAPTAARAPSRPSPSRGATAPSTRGSKPASSGRSRGRPD